MRTKIATPLPGSDSTMTVPPMSETRSHTPVKPNPPLPALDILFRVETGAVIFDDERDMIRTAFENDANVLVTRVLGYVVEGFLRDATECDFGLRRQAVSPSRSRAFRRGRPNARGQFRACLLSAACKPRSSSAVGRSSQKRKLFSSNTIPLEIKLNGVQSCAFRPSMAEASRNSELYVMPNNIIPTVQLSCYSM